MRAFWAIAILSLAGCAAPGASQKPPPNYAAVAASDLAAADAKVHLTMPSHWYPGGEDCAQIATLPSWKKSNFVDGVMLVTDKAVTFGVYQSGKYSSLSSTALGDIASATSAQAGSDQCLTVKSRDGNSVTFLVTGTTADANPAKAAELISKMVGLESD